MHSLTMTIRDILAENFKKLREATPSLSSPRDLIKIEAASNGTIGRIAKRETGVSIDKLEPLAKAYGLAPWQLLVPSLRAERGPHGKPIVSGLPRFTSESDPVLGIEEAPTFQQTGPVEGPGVTFVDAPYFMGPKLRRESKRAETDAQRQNLLTEFLDLISNQDELTLDQMKPLLKRMIDEPHRGPEIIERINLLLDAANGSQTEASAPKSTSSKAA